MNWELSQTEYKGDRGALNTLSFSTEHCPREAQDLAGAKADR